MDNTEGQIVDNNIGEKALKAGAWYVVSNVAVKSIIVLTTPIFTRLMSTAQYGTVQTFNSWYSLLIPVFSLNLTYSIGRAKLDYPGKVDEYTGAMQILSAVFSMILTGIVLSCLGAFSSFFELTRFQTGCLMLYLLFNSAILLRQTNYRYTYRYKQNIGIAWYSIVSTTVLSLILVLTGDGDKADLRIIGIVIPPIVLSVVFWIRAFKRKWLNANKEYWAYGLKMSIPLIFHIISMHILSQSDRIFISKIWGQSSTGIYSLAYTYGTLLHVITNAIAEAWLPWFHDTYFIEKFDSIKKNVKPLLIFGCFIGLASTALAPEAIMILGGKKYMESVSCVPPIIMGVVCQFIYTHYVNIELHLKKTIYVAGGTIVAALINVVLNAIFIPRVGYVAAAYTTLFSYLVLMIIHFALTRYLLKVKIYDDLFSFGALAVTMLLAFGIYLTYDHNIIRYALILVGAIVFVWYYRPFITSWIRKRKARLRS